MRTLSIIIPVFNEGEGIAATLDALADLRALGVEVIVVDGGSRDATIQRARLRADRVISAPRGRAAQMNAGAEKASGGVLLFLHADTRLPADTDHVLIKGLERSGRAWGRFDVKIEGRHLLLLVVAWLMNLRSPLGRARRAPHHVSDVAPAARLFLRCRPGRVGTAIRICPQRLSRWLSRSSPRRRSRALPRPGSFPCSARPARRRCRRALPSARSRPRPLPAPGR